MQTITVERVIKNYHQSAKMTANSHNITRDGIATENPRFHELKAEKGSRIMGQWERTVLEVRQHPSLNGTAKKRILQKLTSIDRSRQNWLKSIFTRAEEAKIKKAMMKNAEITRNNIKNQIVGMIKYSDSQEPLSYGWIGKQVGIKPGLAKELCDELIEENQINRNTVQMGS